MATITHESIAMSRLARAIRDCQIDGKIAVVESGRDCDGCEYSGKVSIVDATPEAYIAHEGHVGEWADGPFYLQIERPDTKVERTSRDLVLEAFEDGHPHVVYSKYP